MTVQLITPNPHIPCTPGWCLQYVREAFGIYPGVYPSATAGWNASPTKHRDWNFPAGRWVPVWFGIAKEPLGHVVLLAPDGSVFSTSDNSTVPHHHPNLADLMNYYAAADLPLTYRGWTEDIENVTVVDLGSEAMGYDGEITTTPTEEDDMFTDLDRERLNWLWETVSGGKSGYKEAGAVAADAAAARSAAEAVLDAVTPGESGKRNAGTVYAALDALKKTDATLDPAELARALAASMPADLAKRVVDELGAALGGK